MRKIRYARLPTERPHPASRRLDRMSPLAIARLMNRADMAAVRAVGRGAAPLARAVELTATALARGGRLVFVGAGTSGRLGVLEAAECPPTFGTPPRLVQAVMAGGRSSVFRAREGAEDDAADGARQVRRRARRGDVVVGVAASGVTPFVRGALAEARRRGAATVLVTCNPTVPRSVARVVVALAVGPEILAGSTRLKAGTATKLILNIFTTLAMVRMGKVLGNLMVDVKASNTKLRDRSVRILRALTGANESDALNALERSKWVIKEAVRRLKSAPKKRREL